MPQDIKTINLWGTSFLLRGAGGVNCYLVKIDTGYILIDTGFHAKRTDLVKELESAGCKPGDLRLILITHGDLDHTGNAAYLRDRFGAPIALHRGEAAAVEYGDMTSNRRNRPGIVARMLLSIVSLMSTSDRFRPDIYIEDGDELSEYGFSARVLHIPGHSQGSIGILTAGGDLFCGDLLLNTDRPAPPSNIDDVADLQASHEKLRSLEIKTVYPGHGKPFPLDAFVDER